MFNLNSSIIKGSSFLLFTNCLHLRSPMFGLDSLLLLIMACFILLKLMCVFVSMAAKSSTTHFSCLPLRFIYRNPAFFLLGSITIEDNKLSKLSWTFPKCNLNLDEKRNKDFQITMHIYTHSLLSYILFQSEVFFLHNLFFGLLAMHCHQTQAAPPNHHIISFDYFEETHKFDMIQNWSATKRQIIRL